MPLLLNTNALRFDFKSVYIFGHLILILQFSPGLLTLIKTISHYYIAGVWSFGSWIYN